MWIKKQLSYRWILWQIDILVKIKWKPFKKLQEQWLYHSVCLHSCIPCVIDTDFPRVACLFFLTTLCVWNFLGETEDSQMEDSLKSYSVLKTWHNQILESDNCHTNIICINILMIMSVIKNMVESSLHWEGYVC